MYFVSGNQVQHGVAVRLTCDAGHSECLLTLGPFAVGIALFATARRGADAPQVHLGGFEEGHHEGLFILRPVAANQARHARINALSCRGRQRGQSVGRCPAQKSDVSRAQGKP